MPCEVIPCIVNNTCIFVEPRGSKLGNSSDMHETKAKAGPQNNMVWTKTADLRGRLSIENDGSSYGRAQAPEGHTDMLENNLTFHDVNHRIESRRFSSLGHSRAEQASSGHVEETSISFSRSRIPNCEPPRQYSSSSWPSETFMKEYQRSRELSAHRTNGRRQSEGFIFSQNKVFGLVGYRNESVGILDGQRSENHDPNTKVIKRERDSCSHKTSHIISLASFNIMNSVATTELDRPANSYYSLPRRLSQPAVPSFGKDYDTTNNGKEQRNSLPTEDYLRQYHFDSDTELQWQRLVARAKTLQLSSAKRPEIICSRLADSNNVQVSQATKSPGDLERGADNLSGKERKIYEVKPLDKENNNTVQPATMRRRRRNEERRYSLKMVPTGMESLSERNTNTCDDKLPDREMVHPAGSRDQMLIRQQRCMINPLEVTTRRHSVAVVRPVQQVNSEKISGYSTHGALEYAKMLMEKIQEAGKTKSKKERLEEMSKVLKIVLEELNRIEMPDRDLVSLFISLRAKMVNLRTELKVDERKEMETEKQASEQKILSNSLPRPVNHEEHIQAHPRRFSWI